MKRFQKILVAVDTRFEEYPALEWAAKLAELNQATLKIIEVIPELSWLTRLVKTDDESVRNVLVSDKQKRLEEIAAPLKDRGIEVESKVVTGQTSFEIIHEVLRGQHDLVVHVTRGAHSGGTGLFGTTSMRLLRKCPCAVWFVRPDAPPRFNRVLATIDPTTTDDEQDPLNRTIMELGQSVAEYESGELHIAHAWQLFGSNLVKSRMNDDEFEQVERKAKDQITSALDNFLGPFGLSHEADNVHLIHSETGAGSAIAELAKQKQINLIVMGTVARTGIAGALMGNTAERVLDQTQCPVLAIKPEGFHSPVTLPDQ